MFSDGMHLETCSFESKYNTIRSDRNTACAIKPQFFIRKQVHCGGSGFFGQSMFDCFDEFFEVFNTIDLLLFHNYPQVAVFHED